jgi:hypothetical protein
VCLIPAGREIGILHVEPQVRYGTIGLPVMA